MLPSFTGFYLVLPGFTEPIISFFFGYFSTNWWKGVWNWQPINGLAAGRVSTVFFFFLLLLLFLFSFEQKNGKKSKRNGQPKKGKRKKKNAEGEQSQHLFFVVKKKIFLEKKIRFFFQNNKERVFFWDLDRFESYSLPWLELTWFYLVLPSFF